MNLYLKNNKIILKSLIDNFINETYIKNKSSFFGLVLYSYKNNNIKNKSGNKSKKSKSKNRTLYIWYNIPGTRYKKEDYFSINKTKYKAWEKKNKKKWLLFD